MAARIKRIVFTRGPARSFNLYDRSPRHVYIYIYMYIRIYVWYGWRVRMPSAQRSCACTERFFHAGGKKRFSARAALSKQRRSRAGKRTTGLRGMIYPCARSFSRKKNKSGKSGEGERSGGGGKRGKRRESVARHAARVRAWWLT